MAGSKYETIIVGGGNAVSPLTDEELRATAVPVSVATIPSHAVTNTGTFAVQESGAALTALQVIDNIVDGSGANISKIAGVAPAILSNGSLRVCSQDYLQSLAEGDISGHAPIEKFGYNPSVSTTLEDVWTAGGVYVYPAAEMGLEIVSSSASDDGDPAGTGIQVVTLYYLDDTFTQKTEDITLNGTTAVATTATDIYRVQRLNAKTVGSAGSAVGTITLRHIDDTPVYATISIGNTRARDLIGTVPVGKTMYITSIFGGCGTAANQINSCIITLRSTYDHYAVATRSFFLPMAELQVATGGGGVYRPFEMPIALPAGTDIKASVVAAAAGAIVTCGIRGWME